MKTFALLLSTLFLAQIPLATVANPAHPSTIAQADSEAEIQQIAKNITVRITAENSGGSGVLIAQKGNTYLVLTNAHVVKRATQIKIQAPDGQEYTATPIDGGFDPKYDLALLQFTSRTKYTLANLSDTAPPLVSGWNIYSAGFPFDSTEIRITKGEVSQLSDIPFDDGTQIGYTMNQGEKGIRQGMSGGAIIDPRGVFLGINTVGAAPILPNYTYVDGSKPLPKLAAQYRNANWGVPVYNFLVQVKPDILYGYKFNGLDVSTIQHQVTPTGYMARLNEKARKMSVRIEAGDGNGSGVIVAKEGNSYYVLTAKHVVENDKTRQPFTDIKIITYDQDNYSPTGTVVAEGLDLAVVKFTSKSEYSVAEIGQYYPNTDDIVFAGGFPGRNRINSPLWQWQLNPGFIFDSEEGRFQVQDKNSFANGYDLIYSSISHGGMSGGGIFDTTGRIIAIHGQTEAIRGIQLGNSQGISIQTFIGIADKLKVNPQLLKITNNKSAVLNNADVPLVGEVMKNLVPPQQEDDGERWLTYANELYRILQYDKSIAAFDMAIAKGKELEGNYGKALSLWKARKLELAEVTIRRAISAVPKDSQANHYYFWKYHSVILKELGRYEHALETNEQAIKLEPQDRILKNQKASLLSLKGRQSEAIKIYDEMIRDKSEAYVYGNRGSVKSDLGQKQAAIADYDRAILINPNFAEAYFNRGSVKSDLGQNQAAIIDYNRAILINPNYTNAYVNRGNLKSELWQKKAAIDDYSRAILINPNHADAYNNRGNVKSDLGQKQAAIADYNRAILINPDFAKAYSNRGLVKSDLGQKQAAIADCDRAILINPNFAEAYFNRGLVKSDLGQKQAAIADYDQAIAVNPNYTNAYYNRGVVKSYLGQKQAAIADYDRTILINPNFGEAYYNRGADKSDLGQKQAAIDDFSKAAELFRQQGHTEEYQQTMAKIAKLKGN